MENTVPQQKELDEKLEILRSKQKEWVNLPISTKIKMLEKLITNIDKTKSLYLKFVREQKKVISDAEEWYYLKGLVSRNIRLLAETLKPASNTKEGKELKFGNLHTPKRVGNQYRVKTLPLGYLDSNCYPGFEVEVWIQPGKEVTQGTELKESLKGNGAVSLVLGAGNQASIGILDAVHKLIQCNEVVFLKHNPINDYLYDVYEIIFKQFITKGYFQQTKGSVAEAQYLIEKCDNVHITGSDKTYDIIVWGKQDKNDPNIEPVLKKPITSELGCVSPVIVVPGNYSNSELQTIVAHIGGGVRSNCSFNCNAAKLVVTHKEWPQRQKFLEMMEATLSEIPLQYAYYPGAQDRWNSFAEAYPQSKKLGPAIKEEGFLQWLWIPDVEPKEGSKALTTEPFSPVLSETSLDATDPGEFMKVATEFVNTKVWGNLSMSLFIHPSTEKQHKEAYEKMIADLKYGSVAVNHWAALHYALGNPWGAHHGNDPRDIQSGDGFVHNFNMLDNIEKSVSKSPLTLLMGARLPYRTDSSNSDTFLNSLSNFEASPGVGSLALVTWAAVWN